MSRKKLHIKTTTASGVKENHHPNYEYRNTRRINQNLIRFAIGDCLLPLPTESLESGEDISHSDRGTGQGAG